MITWHCVATLFLFTATAVSGQTVLPSQGCSVNPTWNRTDNTNVLYGTGPSSGITLETCQQQCVSDTSCYGVDWDTNTSPATCYLNKAPNGVWRVGQAAGVTHYQLLSRGDPGCIPTNCDSWEPVDNQHVLGGIEKSAVTQVEDCQTECENDPLCVGFDFDPTNPYTKCYLSHSTQLFTANGVTHYNRVKIPADRCNLGRIIYSEAGDGFLAIDPDTKVVTVTDDLFEAAVFIQGPCLLDPAGTTFTNCYSYSVRERAGSYLRGKACNLYAQRFNETNFIEKFPQRFNQDASFIRHSSPPLSSWFSLEVVSMDAFYIAGSILRPYPPPSPPPLPRLFFVEPPLPSTVAVKDSCPLVWNRIKGTRSNTFNIGHGYSFEACRRSCVNKPFSCVGVNFNPSDLNGRYLTGYCEHIQIDQPNTTPQTFELVTDGYDHRYYELQRTMPGTCRSGCRYGWTKPSSRRGWPWPIGSSDSCTSDLDCRQKCIKYTYYNCIGVGLDGTQWKLLSSTPQGVSSISISYALSQINIACGLCVNSFATVYNATDSSATLVGSSYTESQCQTVCINNNRCVGYELRDSNVCYISNKIPTLTVSPLYHHVDIVRPKPACGNGCVHDWEFNSETAMIPATGTNIVQYTAATDRACRAACIRNPLCTGIDWVYSPIYACYLGLSADIPINYGNTPGTYHFELKRDNECDE